MKKNKIWKRAGAVILSTALLFSTLPTGVMAEETVGQDTNEEELLSKEVVSEDEPAEEILPEEVLSEEDAAEMVRKAFGAAKWIMILQKRNQKSVNQLVKLMSQKLTCNIILQRGMWHRS